MQFYLIDDEEIIRQVIAIAMGEIAATAQICEFTCAEAAQSSLQEMLDGERPSPDLVVTDINLPGMDGIALCRWIKAQPALVDVPVIVVSGLEGEEVLIEAFAAGAQDFIRKPLANAELLARLHAATSKSTPAAIRREAMRMAEKELVYSQALISSVSNMGVGLLVIEKGRPTYVNPALCRLTGFSERELYSMDSYLDLFHADERPRIQSNHRRRLAGESFESRYITALTSRSGQRIDVEFSVALWENPPNNGVICLVRDVREQLAMQRQLRNLADYDVLTGLPNRRLMQDRLNHALERCARNSSEAAVLFLDLDGFKAVNDTLGHAAGDELLRQVASRLRAGLRASDTAARLAGDEFVLILEADPGKGVDAEAVTKKLLASLRQPFKLTGGEAHVTASVGIVKTRGEPDTAEQILHRADMAMYRVKQTGKDSFLLLDPP